MRRRLENSCLTSTNAHWSQLAHRNTGVLRLSYKAPAAFHTTTRKPKRAHLRVPVFTRTTKIQRDTQRERQKEQRWGGRGRKKKSEIWSSPPFGAPTLRGPPPFGAPTLRGLTFSGDWPKMDWPKSVSARQTAQGGPSPCDVLPCCPSPRGTVEVQWRNHGGVNGELGTSEQGHTVCHDLESSAVQDVKGRGPSRSQRRLWTRELQPPNKSELRPPPPRMATHVELAATSAGTQSQGKGKTQPSAEKNAERLGVNSRRPGRGKSNERN